MPQIGDSQTTTKSYFDWTDAELTAAVLAYLAMLRCELENTPYRKSKMNEALREGPLAGRTESSVEFRMQNISATLYDLRIPHIAGYRPARNVGRGVKSRIKALLEVHGVATFEAYIPTASTPLLNERVVQLRLRPLGKPPLGQASPKSVTTTTSIFVRDPAVKRWVLHACDGYCEGCKAPAPFKGMDGYPYLEVHHVVPLSALGSDRISNAVALCPNCHRRCHFGADRDEFKLQLYEAVARLSVEVPLADDVLHFMQTSIEETRDQI